MRQCIIISHTDLDGMGGIILGRAYARSHGWPSVYSRCEYTNVDDRLRRLIRRYGGSSGISCIIVCDICVQEMATADLLDQLYREGVEVILVDHHSSSDWINRYDWAYSKESTDGVELCGMALLARRLEPSLVHPRYDTFVSEVNAWDTWAWKKQGDEYAPRLNALMKVQGATAFRDYLEKLLSGTRLVASAADLFTPEAVSQVSTFNRVIQLENQRLERDMAVAKHLVDYHGTIVSLMVGVIFGSSHISELGEFILTRHPELDVLMVVNLPGHISLRTQRDDLPISMSELASLLTGDGGGHPQAAGAVIPQVVFSSIYHQMLGTASHGSVRCGKLS